MLILHGSPLDTEPIVTVDIGMGRTAKAISAGWRHTCVILDNDSLKCFGEGRYGALGYGGLSNNGDNETPGELPSLEFEARRTVQSLACGGAFTCVILDNSKLGCSYKLPDMMSMLTVLLTHLSFLYPFNGIAKKTWSQCVLSQLI
jgi:Regulator of chromosome condensation (RCC1) repeat